MTFNTYNLTAEQNQALERALGWLLTSAEIIENSPSSKAKARRIDAADQAQQPTIAAMMLENAFKLGVDARGRTGSNEYTKRINRIQEIRDEQ